MSQRHATRGSAYAALPDADDAAPLLSRQHGGTLALHPQSRSYSYSYGPNGISGLLHNRTALASALFVSIGGLLFGYDQGVVANVLVMPAFVARWPIGAWEKGVLTAALELGSLAGALTSGVLADRYSRRTSILTACIVFCLGSALQTGAQTLTHLILGRAVGGVGVGALSMLSPLYMAEISPPEVRGALMALEQLAIVFGAVLGFWTGYFTRDIPGDVSFRLPLGIQLVPGIVLALGSLLLPPSPRLLVLHGDTNAALAALATLRRRPRTDTLVQIELLEMQVEVALLARAAGGTPGGTPGKPGSLRAEWRAWARLFSPAYAQRTAIGVMMMFFQQWSGINALLYYGPTLMRALGLGLQGDGVNLLVSGGIGIVQFLAVLPAIVFIDRLGRKPLLRGGSMVMTLAHFCIAVLVRQYSDDWPSHTLAAWISVGCVYLFTAAYGVSYGPIGWILPSEVFPLSARSKGVALATASNWFNNFLIGLVTPELMEVSASGTFMIFAVACFLGYLWSTYLVPETANVSLEEIDAVFGSNAGLEELELKSQIEEELGLHDLVRQWGTPDPDHTS